jgi:hypothetical protein
MVSPATREEELEVEAAYWQSVGDTRRAELAEERLQAVKGSGSQPETLFQDLPPSTRLPFPPTGEEGTAVLRPPVDTGGDPTPEAGAKDSMVVNGSDVIVPSAD